jgi:hypothetical protein
MRIDSDTLELNAEAHNQFAGHLCVCSFGVGGVEQYLSLQVASYLLENDLFSWSLLGVSEGDRLWTGVVRVICIADEQRAVSQNG